jgi:hypothetical protein
MVLRTILCSAAITAVLSVLPASRALGYGACHTSYTHVSPNGSVQHVSSGTAVGPGGAAHYSGATAVGPGGGVAHTGTVSGVGAYGGGAYHTSGYAYSPTMYNGYSAAGVAGAGYRAGVVRYP